MYFTAILISVSIGGALSRAYPEGSVNLEEINAVDDYWTECQPPIRLQDPQHDPCIRDRYHTVINDKSSSPGYLKWMDAPKVDQKGGGTKCGISSGTQFTRYYCARDTRGVAAARWWGKVLIH